MTRRNRHLTGPRLVGLAVGTAIVMGACSTSTGPAEEKPTGALDVISWWTSDSEKAALTVLFDAYRKEHPGVAISDGTVVGGSGSNAQVVLASRLRAGQPPDVWQAFPGAALRYLVSTGRVLDVSSTYTQTGLAGQMPKAVLDAVTVDGKQYAVPTSAHRQNVLWFNTAVLAKAGVATPGAGYSLDAFVADLGRLKQSGVAPLCLGGKDAFTKAELFENVLLSVVGAEGWSSIGADRFDWRGAPAGSALAAFGRILGNSDPEAGALTWDQAADKLASGGCGFMSMNDSAYGEVLTAKAGSNTVGSLAFPGTDRDYLAVIDTFVLAKGGVNTLNGRDFLATVAQAGTQAAFSKEKGSSPIRADAPVSSLSAYQQTATKALNSGTVLMSITHGELVSPAFQQGFYDAVAAYAAGGDRAAFNNALVRAVAGGQPLGY